MKTYRQFADDMKWSLENLVAEAQGFKDLVKRRRKKKKEKFLTDREAKIQKLKRNDSHRKGLE